MSYAAPLAADLCLYAESIARAMEERGNVALTSLTQKARWARAFLAAHPVSGEAGARLKAAIDALDDLGRVDSTCRKSMPVALRDVMRPLVPMIRVKDLETLVEIYPDFLQTSARAA
jgi:hypothetical protein